MSDLADLSTVSGAERSAAQIQGILDQIDLDILNLLREGKLAALKYSSGGDTARSVDRAANLTALTKTRDYYRQLLVSLPAIEMSVYVGD